MWLKWTEEGTRGLNTEGDNAHYQERWGVKTDQMEAYGGEED